MPETLLLVFTVIFVYFWTNNPVLANYNLPLTAVLAILYFILRQFFFHKDDKSYSNLLLDTVVLSAILLLVINITGGLTSPLFFLIYFYLFAFALLFDQSVTILISFLFCLFFSREIHSVNAILQILSVLLLCPLAIFFGKQYLKLLESQEKIKRLSQSSKKIMIEKKKTEEEVGRQETNALLWLSLNFKDSLLKIVHTSAELLTDIGRITPNQKKQLESIHQNAKEILNSGEKLKQKIDKETDV